MLQIPIKMPKKCYDCPFLLPDQMLGGQKNIFHCGLILNLQCFGGCDEKYRHTISMMTSLIDNIKVLDKKCLLVKFNKQKAR